MLTCKISKNYIIISFIKLQNFTAFQKGVDWPLVLLTHKNISKYILKYWKIANSILKVLFAENYNKIKIVFLCYTDQIRCPNNF